MNKEIRVVIADASEEFRIGLSASLERTGLFLVVGTACDGEQAVRLASEYRPDILVMDVLLPKLDGIGVLKAISDFEKKPKVVVVTPMVNAYVMSAVSAYSVRDVRQKPIEISTLTQQLQAIAEREYGQG